MPRDLSERDPSAPEREADSPGLLQQVSTEMVRAIKQYYGKGPERARSYFVEDLLFVVMRGGITRAEETLLEAGRADSVRQFRQEFQNVMTERLTYVVEQITGRRVVNYQSQVLFDPDMTVEMFVFDRDGGPEERRETAAAISEVSDVGEAREEDVDAAG
jgi:uncharacterized protein YbcI